MSDAPRPSVPGRRSDRGEGLYDALRDRYGSASPRASGYRTGFAFFRERGLVLEAAGAAPGDVLDLGCGVGLVSAPLAERGVRVVGVDANRASCREAAALGIAAVAGDAFRLPLRDGAVDTVICAGFVQVFPPTLLPGLLREAARVLRPGGHLVLAWRNGRSWMHRLAHPVFTALDRRAGRPPQRLHHHDAERVSRLAAELGLATERLAAVFPPLGWRWERRDAAAARLLGTGFLAVLCREAPGVRHP